MLHSKESEVHQVVDDYSTGGGRIVQSIAATHAEEREQLVAAHEKNRLDYVRVCEDARRQIGSIGGDLQDIDIGKITARNSKNETLGRLKRLQQTFPVE